jgi:hypothetical protein
VGLRRNRGWAGAIVLTLVSAPVIAALVVFLVGAGRIANAHRLVDAAAVNAAHAASEAASIPSAKAAAQQGAEATLAGRNLVCTSMTVSVNAADWGREGTISVTVSCAAKLGELSPSRFGRSDTVTAKAVSVLDSTRRISP